MNKEIKNQEATPSEAKKGFASFLSRAQDVGKKAADGIQKGAKNLSEQAQKNMYEQRMKKYRPIFADLLDSANFKLPKIIKVSDDIDRRNIDVCEGAIGWLGIENKTEILYIYEDKISLLNIKFVPVPNLNDIFVVDRLDRSQYVRVDALFETAHSEKLSELEKIAHYLGAKSCTVEIVESIHESTDTSQSRSSETHEKIKGQNLTQAISCSSSASSTSKSERRGITVTTFSGKDAPTTKPMLKWFAQDNNILNLIDMRCNSDNAITSRKLILKGASSATMSQSAASELDSVISGMGYKASAEMSKKATREHNSELIFEIEF